MSASEASLRELLANCYAGRRVLVTGHSGFVGGWLTSLLVEHGAVVHGYSLAPEPDSVAARIGLEGRVSASVADVRDLRAVRAVVERFQPEVVFHLAAQAFVLHSLEDPVTTLATNVVGTANVLEALRGSSARACVVVTSDKCYAQGSTAHAEGDPLGGDDPYSASKAAAELVVQAYRRSFFAGAGTAVASARAGNIFGGGDRGAARIVPDFVRAAERGETLVLRYPEAIRPWQHVLDAVAGYLRLGAALLEGAGAGDAWNFGPEAGTPVSVGELVALLGASFERATGEAAPCVELALGAAPERSELTLDARKARALLGWRSVLDLPEGIDWTIAWHVAEAQRNAPLLAHEHEGQLSRYLELEARLATAPIPVGASR